MKATKITIVNLVANHILGAQYLKKHIHTVHEGNKDYKCESCGKSFTVACNLKKHIYTVHEGRKDHKCETNHFLKLNI